MSAPYLERLIDLRQAMQDEADNAGDPRARRYAAETFSMALWRDRDRLIADALAFRAAVRDAELAPERDDALPQLELFERTAA